MSSTARARACSRLPVRRVSTICLSSGSIFDSTMALLIFASRIPKASRSRVFRRVERGGSRIDYYKARTSRTYVQRYGKSKQTRHRRNGCGSSDSLDREVALFNASGFVRGKIALPDPAALTLHNRGPARAGGSDRRRRHTSAAARRRRPRSRPRPAKPPGGGSASRPPKSLFAIARRWQRPQGRGPAGQEEPFQEFAGDEPELVMPARIATRLSG